MGWILSIIGLVADGMQWLIGYGQRQIGRKEQQLSDEQERNTALSNELSVALKPANSIDSLREHDF